MLSLKVNQPHGKFAVIFYPDGGDSSTRLRRSTAADVETEAFEILAEVDDTTKMTYMGYQRDDFILDCQYSGSDCNME